MKIVADEKILYVKEAFSNFGEVLLLPGRKISKRELKDADVLLVRSITKVTSELLEGTPVKFVATATIGEDHVDKEFLKSAGILFASAKGCNSQAVAEYFLAALATASHRLNFRFSEKRIGIVGVGNIGGKVERLAKALKMHVVKNDPPLQRETGSDEFNSLEEVLEADIITLHVPLNKGGGDNTFHLLDEKKLARLKDGAVLINTSRGEVVDNSALLNLLKKGKELFVVLDVWENEPMINAELLRNVFIGTPHIAGYSYEGKVNATSMIYNAFLDCAAQCGFEIPTDKWTPPKMELKNNIITVAERETEKILSEIFERVYPIVEDDKRLRKLLNLSSSERAEYFDSLRNTYAFRRELKNYFVRGDLTPEAEKAIALCGGIVNQQKEK